MSRDISIVFLTVKTHSIDGTMKSRQTSRVSYWKVQGECSSFSNIPNDNNLTDFIQGFDWLLCRLTNCKTVITRMNWKVNCGVYHMTWTKSTIGLSRALRGTVKMLCQSCDGSHFLPAH